MHQCAFPARLPPAGAIWSSNGLRFTVQQNTWYVNTGYQRLTSPGWPLNLSGSESEKGQALTTSARARDLPLYAKIAEELRAQIMDGTYGPGALLPSRNELAEMYSVSAITARDALAVLSHEGLAQAIRGRGHIVRRKRPRLNAPGRLYAPASIAGTTLDPEVLALRRVDVYQEIAPDNIALPLGCGAELVWVRRAVFTATADRQPAQIQVSWLPGLTDEAAAKLRSIGQDTPWPQTAQEVTGRIIAVVQQKTRARGANPFEAEVFGIPDGAQVLVCHLTTTDATGSPIEHSRFAWPHDAIRLAEDYSYCPQPRDPAEHR
jgi:DNA-binding GntR family transcriptional regulator